MRLDTFADMKEPNVNSLTDTYTLAGGVEIPCVGFGTWQTPDGDVAIESVRTAIEAGYRHIDTASIYKNETGVGEGVRQGLAAAGLAREDVFVTSKLWNTERGYDSALAAFDATRERLGLDYLDLYLIHWPAAAHQHENWRELNADTWRAFEKLHADGRVRAIGISNFKPSHLQALLENAKVAPMVNQVEFHPGFLQEETREACAKAGILLEAWSPLGQGKLLGDPTMVEVAKRHGATPAQVAIRWCLQHGALPLPKSATPERIVSNANVFGFELTGEDMAAIDALEIGRIGGDPDSVPF